MDNSNDNAQSDQAMQQNNLFIPQPSQPQSNKILWMLSLIIALGVGIVVGYQIKTLFNNDLSKVVLEPVENKELIQVSKTTGEPTINEPTIPVPQMQSYVNEPGKYSFTHPSSWTVVNEPLSPNCTVCVDSVILSTDPSIVSDISNRDKKVAVITVVKENNAQTFDQFLDIYGFKTNQSLINVTETTVGGKQGVSYSYKQGGSLQQDIVTYEVLSQGQKYTISLWDTLETQKNLEENTLLFDSLIDSFKFGN